MNAVIFIPPPNQINYYEELMEAGMGVCPPAQASTLNGLRRPTSKSSSTTKTTVSNTIESVLGVPCATSTDEIAKITATSRKVKTNCYFTESQDY